MKKFLAVLISMLLLTGCGNSPSADDAEAENSYVSISQDEAAALMESEENYIILDVRRPDEYAESHIAGAINVPNESIADEAIPELPDKEQLIFVYCRSGNRSKQASEKLAAMGYSNIREFGGINTWQGEIVTG